MPHGLGGETALRPGRARRGHFKKSPQPEQARTQSRVKPLHKEELVMGRADQTFGQSRVDAPAWLRACVSFGPVALAGALGTLATTPNIPIWYAGLTKPGFTPPNWAFPVAWTT